jgi:hypothetical protein
MSAPTQDDLDRLNAAIVSGERQVSIGGQSVTYQTVDSMIKARNDLQTQLLSGPSVTTGAMRPRRGRVFHGGRGY